MLISAFIFLIFANLVNHSNGFKQNVKTVFLLLVYLWILLIFTFRGTTVPDTANYIKFYNAHAEVTGIEYLFYLVCWLGKSLGFSFNLFLFVYEVVLFSLWFYTSKKYFKDIHLAFLVFLPFMGIYNFGIIIRAGMGLCLSYFAITDLIYNRSFRGYLIYYTIVTCAVLFHQGMIVFYIIPLFIFIRFHSIVLTLIMLISITIPLINIQHLIASILEIYIRLFSFNKFLSYTEIHAKFNVHGVYSLTMIKYWIMAMIFIWMRVKVITNKDIYNCFLNIYISGVFLISLTHFITAGNRLSYMFFFFEFVLVGLLYEYSNLPKKIVFLGAVALSILNYVNLISAIPAMITY